MSLRIIRSLTVHKKQQQIMKSTDRFKEIIKAYLDAKAQNDTLFAVKYENPDLSIDKCVTYILNEVQKSDCNGFEDDEIFGMAMHYYDESILLVGKEVNAKVIVNHTVELSKEEIKEAKEKALQKIQTEAYNDQVLKNKKPVKKEKTEVQLLSLFGDEA